VLQNDSAVAFTNVVFPNAGIIVVLRSAKATEANGGSDFRFSMLSASAVRKVAQLPFCFLHTLLVLA
jgi:hypothetical protein